MKSHAVRVHPVGSRVNAPARPSAFSVRSPSSGVRPAPVTATTPASAEVVNVFRADEEDALATSDIELCDDLGPHPGGTSVRRRGSSWRRHGREDRPRAGLLGRHRGR